MGADRIRTGRKIEKISIAALHDCQRRVEHRCHPALEKKRTGAKGITEKNLVVLMIFERQPSCGDLPSWHAPHDGDNRLNGLIHLGRGTPLNLISVFADARHQFSGGGLLPAGPGHLCATYVESVGNRLHGHCLAVQTIGIFERMYPK